MGQLETACVKTNDHHDLMSFWVAEDMEDLSSLPPPHSSCISSSGCSFLASVTSFITTDKQM